MAASAGAASRHRPGARHARPARGGARRALTGLAVLLVIGAGSLGVAAELSPTPETAPTLALPAPPPPGEVAVPLPSYGASGILALGIDGARIDRNPKRKLEMASITKVITAMMALERKPLEADAAGPRITFDAIDASFYDKYLALGGAVEPMASGWRLSQRQLMEVVLVTSANNYTEALARWAYGSESGMVRASRDWLDEHGLHDTVFTNSNGWPGNTSTIDDLLELGALALADPVIAAIVAITSIKVPQLGTIKTSNKVQGKLGIDGIKTGTLSTYNLLFSSDVARPDGTEVPIVGAVLGAPSKDRLYRDVRSMLTAFQAGFVEKEVIAAGAPVAEYRTAWGDTATVVAEEGLSLLLWNGSEVALSAQLAPRAEAADGSTAGTLLVAAEGRSYAVPLRLEGALERPDFWWRLGNLWPGATP